MRIGFIGLGNMAYAIIKSVLSSGLLHPKDIVGFDTYPTASEAVRKAAGITICDSTEEVLRADTVILAVKPQVLPALLPEIAGPRLEGRLIVSIAAGTPIALLREYLGDSVAIARVMPNINAKVGAATSAYTAPGASAEQRKTVEDIFSAAGTVTELPENLFPVFMAVASASPAFTYMYIDSLAKAAVRGGIPRQQALAIAASSVLGSARMILEGGEHPMALVDQVCSPGGTTIQGVCALQEKGFEHAVHAAVEATVMKDKLMNA